ncbi:uncharacterized protein LOC133359658 isoform X1 [Lethenteron reissneri]|uniref:uncharacterized protein LOC133359658 isoform X1 n=1 Tax=Lethenteron reissneri TaxID=7753 RepID=UPI002AB658F2|nr:uncharacterized protein LOC133359658 isoform X1 [Lethenteron reissneri]
MDAPRVMMMFVTITVFLTHVSTAAQGECLRFRLKSSSPPPLPDAGLRVAESLGVENSEGLGEKSKRLKIARGLREKGESKSFRENPIGPGEGSAEVSRELRASGESKMFIEDPLELREESVGFEISRGLRDKRNILERNSTRLENHSSSLSSPYSTTGLSEDPEGLTDRDTARGWQEAPWQLKKVSVRPRTSPRTIPQEFLGLRGVPRPLEEEFGARRTERRKGITELPDGPVGGPAMFPKIPTVGRRRTRRRPGGKPWRGTWGSRHERSTQRGSRKSPDPPPMVAATTGSAGPMPSASVSGESGDFMGRVNPSTTSLRSPPTGMPRGGGSGPPPAMRQATTRVGGEGSPEGMGRRLTGEHRGVDGHSAAGLTGGAVGLTDSPAGLAEGPVVLETSWRNFFKGIARLREWRRRMGLTVEWRRGADNSPSKGLQEDALGSTNSSERLPHEAVELRIPSRNFFKEIKSSRENRTELMEERRGADNTSSKGLMEDAAGLTNSSERLPQEAVGLGIPFRNFFKEIKRSRENRTGLTEDAMRATNSSEGLTEEHRGLAKSSRSLLKGLRRPLYPAVGGKTSAEGLLQEQEESGDDRVRKRRSPKEEDKGGRKKPGGKGGRGNNNNNNENNKKQKRKKTGEVGVVSEVSPTGPPTSAPAMRAKWRPLVAVLEGEKVVLKCQASGSPEYMWLLNGVRLKKGKGVRINTKKGISRLTISRAGSLHSGSLSCQASNSLGTTTITTTVSVTSTGHLHPCEPKLQHGFCFNGGTCQRVQGAEVTGLSCMCRAGFSGQRCEQQTTPTRLKRSAGLDSRRHPEAVPPVVILVWGLSLGLLLLILSLTWIPALRHRSHPSLSSHPTPSNPGGIPPRLPWISTSSEPPRISVPSGLPRISASLEPLRGSASSELPQISTATRSYAS